MVDGLLTHDRPIHIRCDDSVVRAVPGRLQVLRRSRGYAPEPMALPFTAHRPVLAVGAELKSTVSVAKGDVVVPSHHIGDLEHLATYQSFLQAVDHLCDLYGVVPEVVAHDLHPEYLSTKFALELDLPAVGVQHHHAHVAACLVEHGRTEPVLGLAFDGLGYGPDGTLWGGELLLAGLSGFERVGHLLPVAMPGGVAAIREPWRMAAVWLDRAVGPAAVERALADVDPDRARRRARPRPPAGDAADDEHRPPVRRRRQPPRGPAPGELRGAGGDRAGGPGADGRSAATRRRTTGTVDLLDGEDGALVLDPSPLVARVVAERERGTPPAGGRRRLPRGDRPRRRRRWPSPSPGAVASTPSPSPAGCSRTSASPRSSTRRSRGPG